MSPISLVSIAVLAGCLSAPSALAAGLELTNVTVGSNLQTSATIKATGPAPDAGLQITLTSSDPKRLRLSKGPDTPGSASIVIEMKAGFDETPEFYLQGFASEGETVYTATAPGFGTAKGTVTLTPSAIAIVGPFRGPRFQTTTGAEPPSITVYSVRLDSSLKFVEQQVIAGGLSFDLDIKSSDAAIGKIGTSRLRLGAGVSSAVTLFQPVAAGTTTLSVNVPPGFTTPAEYANVVAVVRMPGILLTSDITIGQNLQVSGVVGLGESAPSGGAKITITSDDPSLLLLSPNDTEPGSKSITVTIGEGGFNSRFYIQGIGRSGIATYSASARGFVSRTGKIALAPSGIVLMPSHQGPPDEAEVLRKEGGAGSSAFVAHLGKGKPADLSVWTAYLDPVTLRSADITVQPLRAGMSLKVTVETGDPAVGTVTTPVIITGGSEHGTALFTPLKTGSTILTATTPEGFTKSANSTTVKAVVKD